MGKSCQVRSDQATKGPSGDQLAAAREARGLPLAAKGDVFFDVNQFKDWFNLDINKNKAKNNLIRQLYKILCPFIQRRSKANLEQTLLPKHKMILHMGMRAMQKRLYCNVLLPDVNVLRRKDKSSHGSGGGDYTEVLNIVM